MKFDTFIQDISEVFAINIKLGMMKNAIISNKYVIAQLNVCCKVANNAFKPTSTVSWNMQYAKSRRVVVRLH